MFRKLIGPLYVYGFSASFCLLFLALINDKDISEFIKNVGSLCWSSALSFSESSDIVTARVTMTRVMEA
jgi:hypothetical protein